MAIKEQDKVFYEEAENGDKIINLPITRANNVEGLGRSANTAYVVGDVVYVDNNKKVALKCTTAGTTSNTELDISGKAVGSSVTDGSVVWNVVKRDLSEDLKELTQNNESIAQRTSVNENEIANINDTLPTKANLGALSMPSGNRIAISIDPATGITQYVAPCDGFASIIGTAMQAELNNVTNGIRVIDTYGLQGQNAIGLLMPVKEGDTIRFIMYSYAGVEAWFYYAQSEV